MSGGEQVTQARIESLRGFGLRPGYLSESRGQRLAQAEDKSCGGGDGQTKQDDPEPHYAACAWVCFHVRSLRLRPAQVLIERFCRSIDSNDGDRAGQCSMCGRLGWDEESPVGTGSLQIILQVRVLTRKILE
jgi:hypothetical protein